MKIKKKDLRKRQAQLPINYPDPEVLPDSLPGGMLDLDQEMVAVELLCKRLAHNEVVVRDAVLAEVPRYLQKVTQQMKELEDAYMDEIATVDAGIAAHPKAGTPYHYHNIPKALKIYRDKCQEEERAHRRREALRDLRRKRAEERRQKANLGRYGQPEAVPSDDDDDYDGKGAAVPGDRKMSERAARYKQWMDTWCDLELVLLKLSRGLFFCLWHSDKPLVQLDCAQKIADLLVCPCTDRCRTLFYGCLLRVLSREWKTIDKYRLDKYMALVRKMMFKWFSWVKEVEAAEHAGQVRSDLGKKKARAETQLEGGEFDEASFEVEVASARDYAPALVDSLFPGKPKLQNILKDFFFIMAVHIVPCSTSVGLIMHMCDVSFDEICRAFVPVPLFLVFSVGIPLYAMSQGNYVEKRVLDQFFPPIAGGTLLARRTAQVAAVVTPRLRAANQGKKPAAADVEAAAAAQAGADTKVIMIQLASICKRFSLCRGTAGTVRVMFNEAELVLRQSADPESYVALTRTAQRRRIEREVDDLDSTRRAVREEREMARAVKRDVQRESIREKVSQRRRELAEETAAKKKKRVLKKAKAQREEEEEKATEAAAAGAGKEDHKKKGTKKRKPAAIVEDEADVSEKALMRQVMKEERAKKLGKKALRPARDSKRKKNYKLTHKDLYEDEPDDDDE